MTLTPPRLVRYCQRLAALCLFFMAALLASPARAQAAVDAHSAVDAMALSALTRVSHLAQVLPEGDLKLSLDEVMTAFDAGQFSASVGHELTYSISSRPIWVRLAIDNSSKTPIPRALLIGASWLDRIEVFHLQGSELRQQWTTGDETAGIPYFKVGLSYVMPLTLSPGSNALYIRVQSHDPLVLTLRLARNEHLSDLRSDDTFYYGLLYGFLVAFILSNLLVRATLSWRRHVDYALYLLTYLVMNVSYTGRGAAWFWGDYPLISQYSILSAMVFLAFFGLRFARTALETARFAPRLDRWIAYAQGLALVLLYVAIALDSHLIQAWLAFVVLSAFVPIMLLLGVYMLRYQQLFSRYFLAAAALAMTGTLITEFAVWGFIPFTEITFHAMELGMVLDATILAMGLSHFVRDQQKKRVHAERLAITDALTEILNRRGFEEAALPHWLLTERHNRRMSVLMLDLDHFKKLNDTFGHALGDQVLFTFARLLMQCARRHDVVGRWGGEEFIIVLPETDATEAGMLAERIRQLTLELAIAPALPAGGLTVSIGISEYRVGQSLDELIKAADVALYAAKGGGRNCLAVSDVKTGIPRLVLA
jgi:two-component system, sensor histidine kinase LadS